MASATRYVRDDERRLASPAVRDLLRRRLAEGGGVLLALLGAALLAALLTYDPRDPSSDTATARVPPT